MQYDGENSQLAMIEECLRLGRVQGVLKLLLILDSRTPFLNSRTPFLDTYVPQLNGISDLPLYIWLSMWEDEQRLQLAGSIGLLKIYLVTVSK